MNKEFENYGWPMSSYGVHWDKDYYEIHGEYAPLHKSHSDYGFIEPIVYFKQYVGAMVYQTLIKIFLQMKIDILLQL